MLDGTDITRRKPHQRARLGIGRTFQRLETFGTLSVRDNVLVAAEMRRGWSRDEVHARGDSPTSCIERIGLKSVAEERVDALPTGTQRLVELARGAGDQAPRAAARRAVGRSQRDRRPTELSASCCGELAADGPRDPARRARHGPRDGPVRPHPRARLRPDHRGRHPDRGAGEPAVRAAYLGDGDKPTRCRAQQTLCEVSAATEVAGRGRAAPPAVSVVERAAAPQPDRRRRSGARAARRAGRATAPSTCCTASTSRSRPASVFALLGPNGAGKSHHAQGRQRPARPDRGAVRLLGAARQRRVVRRARPRAVCARSPRAGGSSRTSPCSRTSAWRPTPARSLSEVEERRSRGSPA